MPRRHLRLLALFAALIIAALTSCSAVEEQNATLPDSARLLADSAAAMRTVTTTHITIDVQGDVPGVQLRSADGVLTQEGSAKGTATMDFGEQILEVEFVSIGDKRYVRIPPSGFQPWPSAEYDPAVILNPDRGIAAVLASGKEATTEGREQVGGVDSYRLQVDFPAEPLSGLLSNFIPEPPQDRTGQVWIAVKGSRLLQAQFPAADGSITVRFSDFDVPVEITAPA
ncbi:MAG: LppX_LprAFG lipoprotein [Pseudonocardiales bacterium]